jgi:GTP-binding protein
MFIDKARIYVKSGDGGNGCISFRREKYVPKGGPDGGNGGKGGDVVIVASRSIKTLSDFYYHPHYTAENGFHGEGKNKTGRDGKDLYLYVPVGTIVYKNGRFVGDLKNEGESVVVCRGGAGGRGNAAFKSSTYQAPHIAEKGHPGENAVVDLELKLIADVGIIGLPNAGKSTFISTITSAKPKIADYPFTTVAPVLGVCKDYEGRDVVFIEVPGLIEGAHLGKGLGLEFLRHVERTKILLHLVDVTGYEGKSPIESFYVIRNELKEYSEKLPKKPMVIGLNKIDAVDENTLKSRIKEFKKKIRKYKIFPISSVTHEGIKDLLNYIFSILPTLPEEKAAEEEKKEEAVEHVFEPEVRVIREGNIFRVVGRKVENLIYTTDFTQDEAIRYLQKILKSMGVERLLKRNNIKDGDVVKVGEFEFIYKE